MPLNLDFSPFPVLETDRLVLRRYTEQDAAEIFYFRSDPEMLKYVQRDPFSNLDQAREMIGNILKMELEQTSINWAVCLSGNNKMIGNIVLFKIDKDSHRAEFGYMLHSDFHNKGIMKEAGRAVLNYAFKNMKLHSIEARIDPENIASQKLSEALGFVLEGHLKESWQYNGRYFDTLIYSRLR
jgi:[ribosomal protein S5]-alanine N-acetyltransferase